MAKEQSGWRGLSTILFGLLMVANAGLAAYAVCMAIADRAWHILPEETAPGVRLLVLVVGFGIAFVTGRLVLTRLMSAKVQVGSAVPASWGMTFLVALLFITLAFAGLLPWALVLVLLLALLAFSVPAFWKLIGPTATVLVLILSIGAGFVAYYLASRA
jgi:hypothetical protein